MLCGAGRAANVSAAPRGGKGNAAGGGRAARKGFHWPAGGARTPETPRTPKTWQVLGAGRAANAGATKLTGGG